MDNPEDHDLLGDFELHGRFWQAHETENESIPGIIKYSAEHGPELLIFGAFSDRSFRHPAKPTPPNLTTLLGSVYAAAGRKVPAALLDIIHTNEPADINAKKERMEYEIYYANRVVLGTDALAFDDIAVTAVEASYEDFEAFVNISPITPMRASDIDVRGVVYRQTSPIKLKHSASSGISFSITDATVDESRRYERDYRISYRHVLNIESAAPISLAEGLGLVFKIRDFLRLCAKTSVVVRRVRLTLDNQSPGSWISQNRSQRSRRRVLNWLLSLQHIGEEHLESVLNNFFVMANELGFMAKMFFTELDSPSELVDARFFHLAGCLEAFHRITKPSKAKVDFVDRLKKLFDTLEPDTKQMLVEDPARFIDAVKNTRNMLAHVDDGKSHEKFVGHQYLSANLIIQAWIVIMMLKRCGIAEPLIRDRMNVTGYCGWGPFNFSPL